MQPSASSTSVTNASVDEPRCVERRAQARSKHRRWPGEKLLRGPSEVDGRSVPRFQEDPKRACKRFRLLPVHEVTAVLEPDQLTVLQHGGRGDPLGDGEDDVARPPEETHRWKLGDLVDPVEEVPRLAPPPDDVAHRSGEGAGAAWLAQVGNEQGDLGPGIAGGGPRHGKAGDRAHPALPEGLDQERRGGESQPRIDLPPEAAGG